MMDPQDRIAKGVKRGAAFTYSGFTSSSNNHILNGEGALECSFVSFGEGSHGVPYISWSLKKVCSHATILSTFSWK